MTIQNIEAKILEKVVSNDVVSLAQKMVKIDSQNPPGNEKELADFTTDFLRSLGLRALQLDFIPNRPNVVGVYSSPVKAKTLLFDGHLDTVPIGDSSLWSVDPLGGVVKNGRLYGRGAVDMKGSIAAYFCALKTIIDSGIELEGDASIVLTSDEEVTGDGTKDFLKKGYSADSAIVGEPTNLQVNTAHKGIVRWKLTVYGKSTHASRPNEGLNAVYIMSKIVQNLEELSESYSQMKKVHPILGEPTLSVGTIKGGSKDNVVPDICEITIDRRLISRENASGAEQEIIKQISKASLEYPELKYKLTMYHSWPSVETPPRASIIGFADNAVKDVTGSLSRQRGFLAACEMRHLISARIPTVILGCGDLKMAHAVDESVDIRQMTDLSKIYVLLTLRYLGYKK